jgi:diaminohydroxyphosphoribosylaminopyrimidine deaminase/5-amino-6-(5-phosphoribosylamino)uracil reductase
MGGAATVRADDPALTCRIRGGRDPLRVIVDGRLRVSPRARVFRQRSRAGTLVATATGAPAAKVAALRRAGAEVLVLPGRRGRIRLRTLLESLWERGVVSVLLEGGGDLAAGALRERMVDRLLMMVAPMLIGGDGRAVVGPLDAGRLAAVPRLGAQRMVRIGPDLLWEGTVQYRG